MLHESTIKRLIDLANEAYKGGLYLKSAKIYHQASELARTYHDDRNLVYCLFLEGVSFEMAGKYDDAIPVLMETAANRSPDANPADVYNASTKLIEISRSSKTATYTQKLIKQTRSWLEQNHKEHWSHKLDLLAGKLAYYGGDFEKSYACHLDGWLVWKNEYPNFTEASHLQWLCKAAFMKKDIPALQQWVAAIEACVKNYELEKIYTQESRLLLFRAERTQNDPFTIAADIALSVLIRREFIEGVSGDALIPALQVLILASKWLDVDRVLNKYKLDNFVDGLIFLGDDRMNRAREALNLPLQDDEYDTHINIPNSHTGNAQQACQYLAQAIEFFTQGLYYAKNRDIRLESDYWCKTIHHRIEKAKAYSKKIL